MKKEAQKENTHFSFEARVKIETLLDEGFSKRKIAEKLKRDPKSIREEIKRNSVRGTYTAKKAEAKAKQRRRSAKFQVLKIAMDTVLKEYVEKHLRTYWSPEGISGRLKYVDTHLPYVGKDAIYAYVESVHGRPLEQYLWRR
jgi:IS30 family transposase